MSDQVDESSHDDTAVSESDRALDHLKESIGAGEHWYIALLQSIGLWTRSDETYNGRTYQYLIGNEAFDWLLLAERLCESVIGLIPESEKDCLLYRGDPPLNLTSTRFRDLIGDAKYHQYLNYFYGVTAEEALIMAVEEEVLKEKRSWGYNHEHDATNEAYRRIYGSTMGIMLRHFRQETRHAQVKSVDFGELKEFTYWSFKFRLKMCEKAKVASDTRKALNWLEGHGVTGYIKRRDSDQEFVEYPYSNP